jgi:hypothetical protein
MLRHHVKGFLVAYLAALTAALALPARGVDVARPPREQAPAATSLPSVPDERPVPSPVAGHPSFYPSERQLKAWVDAGYSAFATGVAHDDAFDVPGISRWFWLPSEVVVIGDAGAVVGISCETPQLLAAYTAWRGTRSALPEAQITDAVYSQLAQQRGYCRFVVVGLGKSPRGLGLEYVLNVNGVRSGQPRVSSPQDEPLSSAHDLLDRRDYRYLSVEVAERFDVEYVVDIQGRTYNRTQARSSVGYERRASVRQAEAASGYTHLVTEIVDFPLVREDGTPLVSADTDAIILEMLAPDASYEVNVSLREDESYLQDELPMVDLTRAVTMAGLSAPPRAKLASVAQSSKVRRALEEMAERPAFTHWILKVSQADPKVPIVTISVQPGRSAYETRKALKAIVLEAQTSCEDGSLLVILEEGGRKFLQGQYHAASRSVVVTPVP